MRAVHTWLKATIVAGTLALLLVFVTLALLYRPPQANFDPEAQDVALGSALEAHPGYLYGRVTMGSGATYEGRLRWGGDQEAYWGDYFNGVKKENAWAARAPREELRKEAKPFKIFGVEISKREDAIDVERQFMARFGDIARIARLGHLVRVTLKNGTVVDLDYFGSHDLDDGVRVWDGSRGVIDLGQGDLDVGPRSIRTIELFASAQAGEAANRLHGTVRSRKGIFTGFVQWNRNDGIGTDELRGRAADKDISLRFDTIASIARHSDTSSLVKLLDGREVVLSDNRQAGEHLGIYVDDHRYGRVLVSWDAFERLDFSPGDRSPVYSDFPPGSSIMGSVTTTAGRRFDGRLVFDLDESETTETLDISSQGVTYNIPFGLVASIVLPASVALHNGEVLEVDVAGDVGEGNAGMLIFSGDSKPEYVRWAEIKQIHFDRPTAMYPPLDPPR